MSENKEYHWHPFNEDGPSPMSRESVDELISSLKSHKDSCDGKISSSDDPMSRRIGFVCDECKEWFGVNVTTMKTFVDEINNGEREEGDAAVLFRESIKTSAGRKSIEKCLNEGNQLYEALFVNWIPKE